MRTAPLGTVFVAWTVRDRRITLANLRMHAVALALALLPIVLAACNNKNGSGPGY